MLARNAVLATGKNAFKRNKEQKAEMLIQEEISFVDDNNKRQKCIRCVDIVLDYGSYEVR